MRIAPGSFGAAEVAGADERALRLIAPLGFRPPRRAAQPVHLQTLDGPLARQALATEAAERLARAGYQVELAPELRISEAGEQALEMIADLRQQIDQLSSLLEEMDDFHDVSDLAAQLVTGPHSPVDAAEELFRRAAVAARRTAGAGVDHDDELGSWFDRSAEHIARIASDSVAVTYSPRPSRSAERQQAASTRSAAARAAGTGPVLAAEPTAGTTNVPVTTRRPA